MRKTLFPFTLIITLMIAGCATSSPMTTPAATPTLPTIPDEWTIKMTHSGGIMGLMRSIDVSSDGNYTVTDERTNKTATGKLSEDEIAALTKMVTGAENIASGKPSGNCADCFIYEIEIQINGKKISTQLDDVSLPASGMEDLVASLRSLINSALK